METFVLDPFIFWVIIICCLYLSFYLSAALQSFYSEQSIKYATNFTMWGQIHILCSLDPNHNNLQIQTEKRSTSLKEKLASIAPLVEDLRTKKEERMKQFADIKAQIEKISGEISGYDHLSNSLINSLSLEEEDLSLRRITECQTHLRTLQKEKVCM